MQFKKRSPPRGAKPGTLMVAEGAPPPRMRLIHFGDDTFDERDVTDLAELDARLGVPGAITWLDIQGLGDRALLEQVAERFQMHPLAIEDVVNTPQRPKSDAYEHNHLIVCRMVRLGEPPHLDLEQVSVLVGKSYVVTFQERPGDVFDPVRERLRGGGPVLLSSGPDYLAYALVDSIIDHYYPVLEGLGDHIEELEALVMERPVPETLHALVETKRSLTLLRRVMWPQRDAMNRVVRDDVPMLSPKVRLFFRDVYDHAQQATEVVESYRELLSSLMNTYLSVVSNQTNEVMRVLTIMSSIFIPLTFIAGVYGMNFKYMPELEHKGAYPAVIIGMTILAAAMLVFFRRRGWLGAKPLE